MTNGGHPVEREEKAPKKETKASSKRSKPATKPVKAGRQ